MWPDRVSNPGFYNVYSERRPQCRSKIHSAVIYMETWVRPEKLKCNYTPAHNPHTERNIWSN